MDISALSATPTSATNKKERKRKRNGWKVSWESRVASDLSAQCWATLLSWSEKPWDFQIYPSARTTAAHWSCYYDHRRPLKTSRDSKANIFEQFPSPPWTFSILRPPWSYCQAMLLFVFVSKSTFPTSSLVSGISCSVRVEFRMGKKKTEVVNQCKKAYSDRPLIRTLGRWDALINYKKMFMVNEIKLKLKNV